MADNLRVGEVKMSPDRTAVYVELIASNSVLADQLEDLYSKQASELARHAALSQGFHERAADAGFAIPPYGLTVDGLPVGEASVNGERLPLTHPKNQLHHYRGVIQIR